MARDAKGKGTEARVGLFVLAALVVAGYATLRIAGGGMLGNAQHSYQVLLQDSSGVRRGDAVRISGVQVGRITTLQLAADRQWPVHLSVTLEGGVRLGSDATARITADSLLGGRYLALDPGAPEAPALEPGGKIYGVPSPTLDQTLARLDEITARTVVLLDQTSQLVTQLSQRLDPLLESAQQLLNEDNRAELAATLRSLRQTLDDSGPRLTALLERLDQTAAGVQAGTADLPELSAQLKALSHDLRTALGPDGARLAGVLDQAERSLASADGAFTTVGDHRDELTAALRDLREAAANFKHLSQSLKEQPGNVLGLRPPKDRRPGDGVEE